MRRIASISSPSTEDVMGYENIRVERDGAVATVTIDRPKALNALNPATIAELLHCCDDLRADHGVRCVVVTGAGDRAFVAGADIAAMSGMSPLAGRAFARRGQSLMRQFEDLSIPVIAAVNGVA